MILANTRKLFSIALLVATSFSGSTFAETTNGDTTIAPSAAVSTNTTGGTNINYQTNNAYNNEFGFAPGIFCRTPALFIGGGAGQISSYTKDDPYSPLVVENNSYNWQNNLNLNGQIGLVVPIGSSVIDDCKALSRQIAEDRRISTELSMIRACASLEKEGLTIDPEKYPLLSKCLKSPTASTANKSPNTQQSKVPQSPVAPRATKMPVTTRL